MKIGFVIRRALPALLASLVLSSCAKEASLISYTTAPEVNTEAVQSMEASEISVAIILPSAPDGGSCMSSAHHTALSAASKALGIEEPRVITAADPSTALDSVGDANVVFAVGFDYMNVLDSAAKENPSKLYACFGGYKYNTTNYTNYYSAFYEAQYLAGIVAAANSTTGKLGIVAEYAAEYPDSAAEINSFALGAKAVDPDVQVIVASLSSRTNTDMAQSCAYELVDSGCDVISIQCDSAAPALVAKNADVMFIGYGSDVSVFDAEHCLTSVEWDFTSYYTSALTAAINGNWASWTESGSGFVSGNYYGNLYDSSVSLTKINDSASDMTKTYVDNAKILLAGNKLEIFSADALSFGATGDAAIVSRDLLDNKGNVMISADGTHYNIYSGDNLIPVDPDTVSSDIMASAIMNYLVEGVTVIE